MGNIGIGHIVGTWVGGVWIAQFRFMTISLNFKRIDSSKCREVGDQKKPKNGGDFCSTSKFSGDLFMEPEAWVDWKMDSLEDVYNFGLPSLKLTFHTWKHGCQLGRCIISFFGAYRKPRCKLVSGRLYSLYSAMGFFFLRPWASGQEPW